jgi:hypothetical protein
MLRRMVPVRSDVSEELSASIIRVTRIGELETLAVTSNWHATKKYKVSSLRYKAMHNLPQKICFTKYYNFAYNVDIALCNMNGND